MDYDTTDIAATYDAARNHAPGVQQRWLDLVASHAPSPLNLIVDLGCGTGRFTQPLSDRLNTRVLGLDPSEKMLAAARSKGHGQRVEFSQLRGEALPIDDSAADMVFMSMVLHHLPDPVRTARECRRVLRPGGCVCVRNGTREAEVPQSRFFRGMQQLIEQTLPSNAAVCSWFEGAGFDMRAHDLITQRVAAHWQEFSDKIALRADSVLARIPDADFRAGMKKLRAYAATRLPQEPVTEVIDFFVFER
jgi:ubiquinone/menaquinone biosynthesis C-methylase UbiE